MSLLLTLKVTLTKLQKNLNPGLVLFEIFMIHFTSKLSLQKMFPEMKHMARENWVKIPPLVKL